MSIFNYENKFKSLKYNKLLYSKDFLRFRNFSFKNIQLNNLIF